MRPSVPIAVSILLLAWSCSPSSGGGGGGGGGGSYNPPGGGGPPLVVQSTNPDDGVLDISRNQNIVISFNQAVSAASVNATTLPFTSPTGAIAGTYTVVANNVTFNPTDALPPSSLIVGTVTTGVVADSYAQMTADYGFAFGVENYAGVIASDEKISQARVAVSQDGLVLAMWAQEAFGPTWHLFAREWQQDTGWGAPVEIPTSGAAISSLHLQCTENNEAMAAWVEGVATPSIVRTARFVAPTGWEDPVTLSTAATVGVRFSMHRGGWGGLSYREVGQGYFVYLNPDGTWDPRMASSWTGPDFEAGWTNQHFAAAVIGNPVTGVGTFRVAELDYGVGWNPEILADVPYNSHPKLAADSGNGAIALVGTGGAWSAWIFGAGGTWNVLPGFDGPGGVVEGSSAVTSPSGEAYFAYRSQLAGSSNVAGAAMDALGNWDDAVLIEALDTMPGAPVAAATDAGEGWVLFSQADAGVESIWRARFIPGAGWSMAEELDEDDFASREPQVAAQGQLGAAVWLRQNGETVELIATILN